MQTSENVCTDGRVNNLRFTWPDGKKALLMFQYRWHSVEVSNELLQNPLQNYTKRQEVDCSCCVHLYKRKRTHKGRKLFV